MAKLSARGATILWRLQREHIRIALRSDRTVLRQLLIGSKADGWKVVKRLTPDVTPTQCRAAYEALGFRAI